VKVIHILHHSTSLLNPNAKLNPAFTEWHTRVANEIRKVNSEIEIECWKPEVKCKEIKVLERDGIVYRMFPSFAFNYSRELSFALFSSLRGFEKNEVILHVHGCYNYLTYMIVILFHKKFKIIVQNHGDTPALPHFKKKLKIAGYIDYGFRHFVENYILRKISIYYALNRDDFSHITKFLPIERVKMLTMGVDDKKFIPMDKESAKEYFGLESKKYIGYVGRLSPEKGIIDLIKAFKLATLQNTVLIIVGSGPMEKELKALVSVLDINDGVIFWGQENKKDRLSQLYSVFELLTLPSYTEGFPTVIIESLSSGTPVVCSSLSGTKDIINNQNGSLFDAGDVDDLKESIIRVLGMQVSKEELHSSVTQYSWTSIVSIYINDYRQQ
jgi:glycosyltransferase involved in cell wall biosynthesis